MDFNKDNYSVDDIYNLIKNEVEENIHLDYKEARALGKDEPKKAEITKDVSAFCEFQWRSNCLWSCRRRS